MSSSRLPDAVAVLAEQLQRSVEEFDSLARKLENDVETQGGSMLEIVERIRSLERGVKIAARDIKELNTSKLGLLQEMQEALAGTTASLQELQGQTGLGEPAGGDAAAEPAVSGAELARAMAEWRATACQNLAPEQHQPLRPCAGNSS